MIDKKKFYINGEWVDPINKQSLDVIDPSTEKSCATISLGGKEDVNKAVNAAKKAYETWGFSSKEERIKLLENLYVLYKKDGLISQMQLRWKWALQRISQPNYKQEQGPVI